MAAPRLRSPDATPRRLRRSSAPASSRWMVSATARPALSSGSQPSRRLQAGETASRLRSRLVRTTTPERLSANRRKSVSLQLGSEAEPSKTAQPAETVGPAMLHASDIREDMAATGPTQDQPAVGGCLRLPPQRNARAFNRV